MLYFILVYLWSWIISPFTFVVLRPFIKLEYQSNARQFLYTVLGIQHTITGEQLIDEGFILPNHRCFLDALMDGYISESTGISRWLIILGAPFIVLLSYIDNRVIFINRGTYSRHYIYSLCLSHINKYTTKRILFYPEGTRNTYTRLDSPEELKSYIKFGLLKSIYEDKKYPVQMLISSNKEHAFNEKRLLANYGVKIHTKISRAIHPKDYATDVDFFNEIVHVWFDCYTETHPHSNITN